jgi:hypothetical protein
MTPLSFWEMSPRVFELKVQGYFRKENRARLYFRETFALLFNVNRSEKTPAIEGADVIALIGEKPKRKVRESSKTWTKEEIQVAQERINRQAKREREEMEAAVNGLNAVGIQIVPRRNDGEYTADYLARLNGLIDETKASQSLNTNQSWQEP